MTISKKQILGGLGIYFALRLFSYFFSPNTPLYAANPINWIVSVGILLLAVYFLLLKDQRGWLIIAAEIILGGAGSFLEIKGVALRTILLVSAMAIFSYQTIKEKQYNVFFENKKILAVFSALYAIAGISAIRGYYLGHDLMLVLADTIPYLFFLYYFPLKQLLSSEKFRQTSFNLLIAAIVGNFIFTYFTLAGFSSGIFVLQNSYYHWFRDVASGKITDYGTGFFRIVLNEQLLIVPLFLFFISDVIYQPTPTPPKRGITIDLAMTGMLLAILTTNLTRIYFMALAVGALFLSPVAEPFNSSLRGFVSLKNWKRWLAYCAGAFIFFMSIFTLTHLAATKGKNLGWEYLGLRLQSIALPQTEDSSLSRLLLLPKIIEKIKLHPLLGNGLGDTVTVYSPIFKENITTSHFDWGYLEIIAEMGIIGLVAWLGLITYCLVLIAKKRGALASFVALLVINITSPALFHVLGIIFLTCLLRIYDEPPLSSSSISSSSSSSLSSSPSSISSSSTFHQDTGSAI